MRVSSKGGQGQNEGKTIQLSLISLVILSVGMMLIGGALVFGFVSKPSFSIRAAANENGKGFKKVPPWGEMKTFEIEVERPEEYVAEEISTNIPQWKFDRQTPDQVRSKLLDSGMPTNHVDRLLAPPCLSVAGPTCIIKPDDEAVLSLTPAGRAKLYRTLADSHNLYMEYPFCFARDSFDNAFADTGINADVVSLLKTLVFPRGNADCFSDVELVMRRLGTDAERLKVLKVLSRQSAIMMRLEVHPDTDLDKVLAYWKRGPRHQNLRPLMESLKRLPDGGTMSLLYLLPPFARNRLYTYPDPTETAKHPRMDCHWSSFNFFRDTVDDRFGDPNFAAGYLMQNYALVPLAKCQYGDIILILKGNSEAIHSAVYLAEDVVFTKNGLSRSQPWILMRLKDMLANFPSESAIKVLAYRNKNE